MTYKPLKELNSTACKRACGVSRKTFIVIVEVIQPHLERQGKHGGQNSLSVEDQLLIALQYWRKYRTQFHIGLDFGVLESTICPIVEKVETLLVQSGDFLLPGKRRLQQPDSDWEVVVIDVTQVAVERPPKKRQYYSAAKAGRIILRADCLGTTHKWVPRRHTLKAQLVIDLLSGQFLAVACEGSNS